jgi:hypothetical protein
MIRMRNSMLSLFIPHKEWWMCVLIYSEERHASSSLFQNTFYPKSVCIGVCVEYATTPQLYLSNLMSIASQEHLLGTQGSS